MGYTRNGSQRAAPSRERRGEPDPVVAVWAALTVPTSPHDGQRDGEPVEPDVDLDLWELHVRYWIRREVTDRRRLVEHYHPHARGLARRLHRGGDALDDIEQVASEALLLALDRFDPSRRLPFLGFATPTIVGSVKRHYRDIGWSMRLPRRVHDLAPAIRDGWDQLCQDLGRTPSRGEVADLVGLEVSEVDEVLAADADRSLDSLDRRTERGEIGEQVGRADRGLDLAIERRALEQIVTLLSETDRRVLQLYFLDEMTQSEVAAQLGVSQMQVSRTLDRVLRRLRSHL
jgi:RNA polymerase sigma-B factor